MKARDIMTPNPEVLTRAESVRRAAEMMKQLDVGFLPIVDDRNSMGLQGVITDRDIAIRVVADGLDGNGKVGDYMSEAFVSVSPDSDAREVLDRMGREQVRRVPVVENGDRIIGVIAQADIATRLGDQMPEDVENTVGRISRS
jgi:CBS domain-containing protein